MSGIHLRKPITEPRGPYESGTFPRPVHAPARESALPIVVERFDPVDKPESTDESLKVDPDLDSRRVRAQGVK
jgi:hypothetical protein